MLKLLVVYLSITGQTRKFVHKLDYPLLEITPDSVFTEVQEPYIVVVPTYEKEATEIVNEFIEVGNNRHYDRFDDDRFGLHVDDVRAE